ncbi:hypothetical protein O9363_00260 [Proteus vulgaris]|uniref:hypothetical protein n=1 Tax=Proteus vulgaris TaxID=585 RepID=UPI002574FC13|nr:hypothetical protein [Proteus vulgaris]MDM3558567.1 hypothetical protein [Proteus vulgaris]
MDIKLVTAQKSISISNDKHSQGDRRISTILNSSIDFKANGNNRTSEESNKVLSGKIKELIIEKNIQGKSTTRVNNKNSVFSNEHNKNMTQSVSDDLKQIKQAISTRHTVFKGLIANSLINNNKESVGNEILSKYNNFTSLAPEFHNKSSKAMSDFSISLELKYADEAIIFSILENNNKNDSVEYVKDYLNEKYQGYIDARKNKLNITNRAKNILKTMGSNKFDKKIENLFELVNDFKNKNIVRNKSDLNTHDIFQGITQNYLNDNNIHVNLEQAENIIEKMIKDKGLEFAATLNSEKRLETVNSAIDQALDYMEALKLYENKNDIIKLAMGKTKSINRSNMFMRGVKGIRNLVIGKDNSKIDRLNKLTEGLIVSFESNTLKLLAENIREMENIKNISDNDINPDKDRVKNED